MIIECNKLARKKIGNFFFQFIFDITIVCFLVIPN